MSLLKVPYGVHSSITELPSKMSLVNDKVSAPLTVIILFALSRTSCSSVSSVGDDVSVY